ncbi:protein yellow [Onthophagus taurus]|uniref:protein yellow n=1 Tax=Onthophagus taurus TaxID=166361 RepID=UPI0039BDEF2B
MRRYVSFLTVCGAFAISSAIAPLEELFSWNQIDYTWPSLEQRQDAISKGTFAPENNLPLGLEKWNDKLFVTVPRWKSGVGSSLNYISLKQPIDKSSFLIPYPSWEANTIPSNKTDLKPDHIISTFRIKSDVCDRLWVMDTGVDDILGSYNVVASPAIVIFDLKTDTLIKRYELKKDDAKDSSFFANIVVDVDKDNCNDAYAYIPDLGGYGIVIYSLASDDSWRVEHNFFHFDPLQGDLTVGGVNFHWTDGVFGIALSNKLENGHRTAFFHSLASTKEFGVCTSILKNKTAATTPGNYYAFKVLGDKGDDSQTSASDFDPNSEVLFFTQLQKDGVACWNTKKVLAPENVALVAEDGERLVFTNDIKLARDEPYLYILSDRMPEFLYGKLDQSKINYRIFRLNVNEAIKGTPCAG